MTENALSEELSEKTSKQAILPQTFDPSERQAIHDEMWLMLEERMRTTFSVTQNRPPESTRLESRMQFVVEEARLYYRYYIPAWPLKMMVRKFVRRLFRPLILPQVDFNQAVRDVLQEIIRELRQRSEHQASVLRQMEEVNLEMEQRVRLLDARTERLMKENAELRALLSPGQPAGMHRNGADHGGVA